MNPQTDFVDALELQIFRTSLLSLNEESRIAIAREIALMRIYHVADKLFSLRYIHSESTLQSMLASLNSPDMVVAFQMLRLDPEKIIYCVEFHVRRLGTTRPDDFWHKCGVGRPRKKGEVTI